MQKLQEIESGDKVLGYEGIYLIPCLSGLKSRGEASVGVNWAESHNYSTPICPANMPSVLDVQIAKYCSQHRIPYFYHRFSDTLEFVRKANQENWPTISISIGVKEQDKRLLDKIREEGLTVHLLLIDVAHGHADSVTEMLIYARALNFYVGAGNVWGDRDSIEFLQDNGASFAKIGLSCGKNCQTYGMTGFGSPMFSAAIEAGKWCKIPAIIDGGVRTNGDIAIAIRGFLEYGDSLPLIMVGSLMAACIDAPGENVYKDGRITHKHHYGNASRTNKLKTGQELKHFEGFDVELLCNGLTFAEKIEEIRQSLSSAVSYSGGDNLMALKEVKWVRTK